MSKPVKAWCIKGPSGDLRTETIKHLPERCREYARWSYGYKSWKSMYGRGYRCVRVEIREVVK